MKKIDMVNKYFNKRTGSEILKEGIEGYSEIRIRAGKPVILQGAGKEKICNIIISREEIDEILGRMTEYSVYAFNEQIRKGFITLPGGYRVGIGGRAVMEKEAIKTIRDVTSLNIRMPNNITGCGDEVIKLYENGFKNTVIASPPGCGKTTMLRDIIRWLSGKGYTVGVCDERDELNCFNDLGIRTDIIGGCGKVRGIDILVRGLAPDIIAVDELGGSEDIKAVRLATYMGVGIICTIHGEAVREELREHFKYFIILKPEKGRGKIWKTVINKEF